MLSPWGLLSINKKGSYLKNEPKDYLTCKGQNRAGEVYCPDDTERSSPWVSPINGDADFWSGTAPDNQFWMWGQNETMADTCAAWAGLMGATETFVEPNGVHDSVLILNERKSLGDLEQHVTVSKVVSYLRRFIGGDVPVGLPIAPKL
jgi:acetyl esterase/lipase